MKKNLASNFLVSALLLLTCFSFSFAQTNSNGDKKTFNAEVLKLREAKNYKALEDIYKSIVGSKARFSDGTPKLVHFYALLGECQDSKEVCRKALDEWALKFTDSCVPVVISVTNTIAEAFKKRGESYVQGKPEENLIRFQEEMNRTLQNLMSSESSASKDPNFYVTKMSLLKLMDAPETEVEKAFQDGVKLDPTYDALFTTRAFYLLPKWGGEEGEIEKFADESIPLTKSVYGSGMYARIAEMVRQDVGDEFYYKTGFSWEKISQGYSDLISKFPDNKSLVGLYLIHARLAEDKAVLNQLMSKLSGAYSAELAPLSGTSFVKYLEWMQNGKTESEIFPLITAVRKHDKVKLDELLKSGIDVNAEKKEEGSALSYAVAYSREFVPMLLSKGANPQIGFLDDLSNVHRAVAYGDIATTKLLLKAGAKPFFCLPTAIAEDYREIIKELIAHGEDVNESQAATTPLMTAVYRDRIEALKLLLARPEIKVNEITTGTNTSPLHLAVYKKNKESAELLLKAKANPNLNVAGVGNVYDVARKQAPELIPLLSKYAPEDASTNLASAGRISFSKYMTQTGYGFGEDAELQDEVLKLVSKEDWKALTDLRNDLVKNSARMGRGRLKLPTFYAGLLFCPNSLEDCKRDLDKWEQADSSSAIAQTAQAQFYKVSAEKLKEQAADPNAPAEVKKQFRENLDKAWSYAQKATINHNRDGEAYTVAMNLVALDPTKQQQATEVINSGSRDVPTYEEFWYSAVQYHLDSQQYFQITPTIDKAAKSSAYTMGEGMYARLASYVSRRIPPDTYLSFNLSWPRIRTGFQDLHKQLPTVKRPMGQYLAMARFSEDKEAAKEALVFLENKFDPSINDFFQEGQFGFQDTVIWARGSQAATNGLLDSIKSGNKAAAEAALANGELVDGIFTTEDTTPLLIATEFHPELIDFLVSKGANINNQMTGKSALQLAIEKGKVESVQALIAASKTYGKPLEWQLNFMRAVESGKEDIVKEFFAIQDFDPLLPSLDDKSALNIAIEKDSVKVIKTLLSGSNPNVNRLFIGTPALLQAVKLGKAEIAKILIEKGANPFFKPRGGGDSPYAIAKRSNNAELMNAIASASLADHTGFKWNPGDENVIKAVRANNPQQLATLLPIDLKAVEEAKGLTALHIAIIENRMEEAKVLLSDNSYKYLLNTTTDEMPSPLATAVAVKNMEMVKLLVSFNAEPTATYRAEETPLQYALRTNNTELLGLFAKALEKWGAHLNDVGELEFKKT